MMDVDEASPFADHTTVDTEDGKACQRRRKFRYS